MSHIKQAFKERAYLLKRATNRSWVKITVGLWAFICFYDTVGSQLFPKWLKERLPSAYEVIDMTSGFLPLWAWLLVGMTIVCVATIEYAAKREGAMPWRGLRPISPFEVSFGDSYGDDSNEFSPWHTTVNIRNLSPETIDGVEVRLLRVARKRPSGGGHRVINMRLVERGSGLSSFSLHPQMAREMLFIKEADAKSGRIHIGPLESGAALTVSPHGIFKADIAVYGRGASPLFKSLAVGVSEPNALMFGDWSDDVSWPFTVKTLVTAATPSPQSPP